MANSAETVQKTAKNPHAQASAAQLHDQNLYRAILQGAGA